MKRAQYQAELRAAIGRVLEGRTEVAVATVSRELPDHWQGTPPSPVTISKAIAAMGWVRRQRPGSGVVFHLPAGAYEVSK